MRPTFLAMAFVFSASVAHGGEPVRLAQASGGLDASTAMPAPQRSLSVESPAPAKPAEAKPAETKAAETKPDTKADTKSTESASTEPAKSPESKSPDTKQSDDKKKPVAKRRETDEEKARRIAKRYGVTW